MGKRERAQSASHARKPIFSGNSGEWDDILRGARGALFRKIGGEAVSFWIRMSVVGKFGWDLVLTPW